MPNRVGEGSITTTLVWFSGVFVLGFTGGFGLRCWNLCGFGLPD